jgi:hypothetical protein
MTQVYTEAAKQQMNDMIDSKIRRMWFENYEANKPIITIHGSLDKKVPVIKDAAIVVGAGWSLDRNIWKLKGLPEPVVGMEDGCEKVLSGIPIIACDKIAWKVAKYVKPYAVTALNTEKTKIKEWIRKFREVCDEQGYDMNDIWLITPVTINPEVFEEWRGDKIAFTNPENTCPELCSLVATEQEIPATWRGSNVGVFSLITAVMLGAKQVVMLGMNYCYQTKKEAEKASRGFGYVAMLDITQQNPFDDEGKGYVYTALEWVDMRTEMMNFAHDLIGEVKITNCSEGGILYDVGVVDACDFGAWKTFLRGCDDGNTGGTTEPSDRRDADGNVGEELPEK